MNRRRKLVLATGLLPLAPPLAGWAQPSQQMRRIGYLSLNTGGNEVDVQTRSLLRELLQRRGWIEGKNLQIERRYAGGHYDRLNGLAKELVSLNVELIVAALTAPIAAAQRATTSIPIVMYGASLPVERGYVSSLAHPAGNVTGTSGSGVETAAKYIQILRDVAPTPTRLALLTTPWSSDRRPRVQGVLAGGDELDEAAHKSYVDAMGRAAVALGMTSETLAVETSEDITRGLERIAASKAQMLWVSYDGVIQSRLRDITSFAIEHKILSIGVAAAFTSVGGALYYGPNPQEIYDRSVSFIDRILRGAKPGDLPVEEPTNFDLIINMKTMRAIGITVPQSVLVRATGLIE